MIKQEIQAKLLATDFQEILAADEGKAHSQLKQEIADVLYQPSLNFPLLRLLSDREKFEVVRVLYELLRKVRLAMVAADTLPSRRFRASSSA